MRVVVQFGTKKLYTGLVVALHENRPSVAVKDILDQFDTIPIVNQIQFDFWKWMAAYYLCTEGEVMNVALPPMMKMSSETIVSLNTETDLGNYQFDDAEYRILSILQQEGTVSVGKLTGGSSRLMRVVKKLIDKNAIVHQEQLETAFKPRFIKVYTLPVEYRQDPMRLHTLLDLLTKKAPKQAEVMNVILHYQNHIKESHEVVPRATILNEIKHAEGPLKTLTEKGYLLEGTQIVSRLPLSEPLASAGDVKLTDQQKQAFELILQQSPAMKPVLLHGITSSGKTEIYIKLIDETLKQGRQVLYLLPEIALTTQIISRLRHYFGNVVGVYHSRYGEAARAEVWNKVVAWNPPGSRPYTAHSIILGARSSLFLPYRNLGLIIVDEEHDSSYKQQDPNPRYHARDSAVYLATLHGARVVLGSATPSVESYFNAEQDKYTLVELTQRYGNVNLPRVEVADMRAFKKKEQFQGHFSRQLLKAIDESLKNREQVILFLNRRGFAHRVECPQCHWVPGCRHCDVTLIYHKHENNLRCHYCGYSEKVASQCPVCRHPMLSLVGFGTEKVEEDLQLIYPDARIERMDLDTTQRKDSFHRLISNFEKGKTDILTGTQMVTKGLDFENVSLVGILNADNMIFFPDFRAYERSYQLMAQVSGRAGRKNKRGKVIIQTHQPDHEVIRFVCNNDYPNMYARQMEERQSFSYPPFVRLVKISLKHKEQEVLDKASGVLAARLRKAFPRMVLGPEYPLVSRIQNMFIKEILIKLKRDQTLNDSKQTLLTVIHGFQKNRQHPPVKIVVDVDPQ